MSRKVALISAVPAAIAPATEAVGAISGVEVWNLLDDRLLPDANARGGIVDDELAGRMERLIRYAVDGGADAVLLTCSLYGFVAQRIDVPVLSLAPDQAAFDAVAAAGPGTVLVVASFASALTDSCERLTASLAEAGSATTVRGAVADDALPATKSGDLAALQRALIDTVEANREGVDAVFLAQYSLAPALPAIVAATGLPVFAGPQAAAELIATTFATA